MKKTKVEIYDENGRKMTVYPKSEEEARKLENLPFKGGSVIRTRVTEAEDNQD